MAVTYGTPIALKRPDEEDENGLKYGEPMPLVFGDYSLAEYGEPVPMEKFEPMTPPRERSIIVRRPEPEEIDELRQRYAEGTKLTAAERMTSTAPGGGVLGLPSPESLLERRYPGAKEKMQALEDAAWAGREESGWGEVFVNTLRNVLPKFRRQIVGGLRGGTITSQDLINNGLIESDQFNMVPPEQSVINQQLAEEWGFKEGSDKVPAGMHPVTAFSKWLDTEEGQAEVQEVAANTPTALVSQDIWDVETGKINENAIQVKPHSLKYYAAGILDAGINMGPAVAATIITKSPTVGAAIMGSQVYGQTYGEMLDRGYSPDQAMSAALFSAAAETLTERIPLGILTKGNYSGLKRILAGASAEGIQEPLTEALQMGYDVGILNEDLAMSEAIWRLIDAGIIGFGVGGGIGAGIEVLDRVSTPAAKEAIEYNQFMDTLHLDVSKRSREERQLTELDAAVQELDEVVNNAAADLTDEQRQSLVDEGLIRIRENGTVQVLPKARRQFNEAERKASQSAIEQEAKDRGMDDAQASVAAAAAQVQAEPADIDVDVSELGPTEQQKKAGNYRKGHARVQGLDISIENPAGSMRRGVNKAGKAWSSELKNHYGYIRGTVGKDKDHIDVFIGPQPSSERVFVVNQKKDQDTRLTEENFDEHKVMLGFETKDAARDGYLANYEKGWQGIGSIVSLSMDNFKQWMKSAKTKSIMQPAPVGAQVFHAAMDEGLGFYSALAESARNLKQEKGNPQQMLATMKKAGGIKDEEIEWTGLTEFLEAQGKSVTKGEIVEFLDNNGVQIEEVQLSEYAEQGLGDVFNAANYGIEIDHYTETFSYTDAEGMEVDFNELPTQLQQAIEISEKSGGIPKFANYTLPGGTNYREVLLRLPRGQEIDPTAPGSALASRDVGVFFGGHFDQPNVLAHFRIDDREGLNGEKILFVEEIQSDWHKAGRRHGYDVQRVKPADLTFESIEPSTVDQEQPKYWFTLPESETNAIGSSRFPGWGTTEEEARQHAWYSAFGSPSVRASLTPDVPFKGNAWAELSIKRLIRMTAEGGYDQMAWTTGEQQANRYDLSKKIDSVTYDRGNEHLVAYGVDGRTVVLFETVPEDQIETYIGKEAAKKLMEAPPKFKRPDGMTDALAKRYETSGNEIHQLSGVDLKVGGEGMKSFYDRALKNIVGKVVKKLDKSATVHSIDLPDAGGTIPSEDERPTGRPESVALKGTGYSITLSDGTFWGMFGTKEAAESALVVLQDKFEPAYAHAITITDEMRQVVMGKGLPLFAAVKEARPGISVESLQAMVEEMTELYPNAPNVRIARDEYQLPTRQWQAIQHARMEGKVSGLFDPDTGIIHLIASNLPSRAKALEVFLHESVGHYGLRSILGADYDTMMDKISKAYPAQVKDAAKRNGLNPMNMFQRRVAAEEFIAYRAQRVLAGETLPAKEASLLQQLIELIRIAIARLRGLQMTDVDVERLIRKARLFVATPNAKGRGMLRNRQPPVLFSGLWLALNQDRVPMSASADEYASELEAQIRAGNISQEDAGAIREWLTRQTGNVDKAELMDQVRELGNAQAFHVEQYDGRRNAIENGDLYESFTIPEGSRNSQAWNYLVFKAQDKFIDLLNVQKAIEQQSGRKLDDNIDAYLSEELFHGRVKSRIDKFHEDHIKPLIDEIEASDYTWDEVEWYLYARHAPEANRRLYQINRSGAIRRRRDQMKKKATEKFENRMKRLGIARAKARNDAQAEHTATLRVIDSEYRSQMRRSRPSQQARRSNIEAAKQRKTERADAEMAKRIDQAESKYILARDDYDLTRRAEIEEADTQFREKEEARVGEDPGLLALSGMSDPDAKLVMETMRDKGNIRGLEKIAALIDKMTARNREIMVDEGLETQETIDAWEAAYDYYVPLKGFKDGPMNTTFFPKKGKGYDTGGKLQKRRLGRRSLAANIMANVVAQHQSAVILAEKASVGRTLLKMVQEHPNPDLWTANEVEIKRRLDPKTGLVVTAVDPTYKLKDNVLRVKVDGKDFHITFNENNAAAMRIASSMKNMSSQEINMMFQGLLMFNRILSAVNTSYNPEFIVSNLVRDLQTAMINLNATDANKMKMAILKDVFKAHRGIRRFMDLPSFKNQESADYWRAQFEEYRNLGGQVGWLDNYKDVRDLEASLYREMHDRTTGMISWATLRKMGNYIERENQAVENAVRLSAFVHARNAGLSGRRAASLAKNLTVNFNRKGDIGTAMNALYLFYNASIQGMAIMYKAAKSPAVRKVMYGIMAFAAALEIMNRMIGGDDDDGENRYDKIPAWVKERNMIVMLPERYQSKDPESFDDYYITIPLPYGYNILHAFGQKIGGVIDYTGIGNKREWKPMEDAAELMSSILGSFNPIGTGPTPLQTIIPTFLLPLVQSSENVAWHGGPIVPPLNAWDPAPPPESQQFFRSVPAHAKVLAEFLNQLGGGTKARPADFEFMDISPETIQLWEDFLTGGAGRFVSNMVEVGVMIKKDEIDIRKVPFARRFVGLTDERAVSNRYYEHRTEIEYAVQEIKVAGEQVGLAVTKEERADAMQERARIIEQYQPDAALQGTLKIISEHLKNLNVQRKAVNNSKRPDEWKEEKVEQIELKKTELMNKFNKKYNEIMQRRREQREQASINPQLSGKERLAAVRDLNNAGYSATATLVKSLPTNPSSSFVEKLNA